MCLCVGGLFSEIRSETARMFLGFLSSVLGTGWDREILALCGKVCLFNLMIPMPLFKSLDLAWRFQLQMFSKDIPGDQTFVGERERRKTKTRNGQGENRPDNQISFHRHSSN